MGLKDAVVRTLAHKILKGKIDGLRKAGSMKALDGKKQAIVTLGFVASGVLALATGQDVSQWLDLILRAVGWNDPDTITAAKAISTQAVPLLFAIWASVHGLFKMYKQSKAGVPLSEIGSSTGVVKAALAQGAIVDVRTGDPLVDIQAPAKAAQVAATPSEKTIIVEPKS